MTQQPLSVATGLVPGRAASCRADAHLAQVRDSPGCAALRIFARGQGAPRRAGRAAWLGKLKGYQYAETFTQRIIVAESG